jgi:hypothetical protein
LPQPTKQTIIITSPTLTQQTIMTIQSSARDYIEYLAQEAADGFTPTQDRFESWLWLRAKGIAIAV